MALGTNFQVNIFTNRGASLDDIAATASSGDILVFWVNFSLHGFTLLLRLSVLRFEPDRKGANHTRVNSIFKVPLQIMNSVYIDIVLDGCDREPCPGSIGFIVLEIVVKGTHSDNQAL